MIFMLIWNLCWVKKIYMKKKYIFGFVFQIATSKYLLVLQDEIVNIRDAVATFIFQTGRFEFVVQFLGTVQNNIVPESNNKIHN